MDYLALTVWADVPDVQDILTRGVLDRYGFGDDLMRGDEEWIEKLGGSRAERILDAGGIAIIEYRDEVLMGSCFCSVEVKGVGCERLGNEGIRLLLDDLSRFTRCRASRVDVMAHTRALQPVDVLNAVLAGDVASRAVTPEKHVWISSAAGTTCYLGMSSKPKGGMKRCGDRVLRVYDRREATRVELQMRGEYAHGAGDALMTTSVDDWPTLVRGMMRHYCDFVDRTGDARVTRCPLLPWWESFVGDVEKISVRSSDPDYEGTPIGKLDGIFQRYARRLYAALEAYGEEWIVSRVRWHGGRRAGEDHDLLVAELRRYLGSRFAGVPERDEEPPF